MKHQSLARAILWLSLLASVAAHAAEPVRLANDPALSPDGKQLVFSYNGDLWSVPATGGTAKPITRHD